MALPEDTELLYQPPAKATEEERAAKLAKSTKKQKSWLQSATAEFRKERQEGR